MGFYLRKSVNFGGVRFNSSQSGIGASVGVKGFRIGTGPRGNYVHMGRNGVYYRAASGQKKAMPKRQNNIPLPSATHEDGLLFQEIESGDISLIVDSSSQDLIAEINQKNKMLPFWPLAILLAFIPSFGVFFAIVAGLLIYLLVDKKRRTTILFYDIEEDTEQDIQKFYDAFDDIVNCHAKWHVSAQANVKDRKYHAGASALVKKTKIEITYKTPPMMKTNIKVPAIPVGKQTIYMFPDKILMYEKKNVGGLSYQNLHINQNNQRFIESGTVPKDGTIVDHTWRYVNKSGGPDKRFKDNRQLPILLYSDIIFTSDTGLNEQIELSRAGAGSDLAEHLTSFAKSQFFQNGHVSSLRCYRNLM